MAVKEPKKKKAKNNQRVIDRATWRKVALRTRRRGRR